MLPYYKAMKYLVSEVRKMGFKKVPPHLRVALKSHARRLAMLREFGGPGLVQ